MLPLKTHFTLLHLIRIASTRLSLNILCYVEPGKFEEMADRVLEMKCLGIIDIMTST